MPYFDLAIDMQMILLLGQRSPFKSGDLSFLISIHKIAQSVVLHVSHVINVTQTVNRKFTEVERD